MGLISKFEGKMEDAFEGGSNGMGNSPISPVQIAKKAEKEMRREKMVGAGKQYAPTLYTVLVNPEDDQRMFGYYPTLAGETETYLAAKASEEGLVMDGQPLVRFIVDDDLKHGKFEVIAEAVAAPIVSQLRQEEMERYGLAAGRSGGYGAQNGYGSSSYSYGQQNAYGQQQGNCGPQNGRNAQSYSYENYGSQPRNSGYDARESYSSQQKPSYDARVTYDARESQASQPKPAYDARVTYDARSDGNAQRPAYDARINYSAQTAQAQVQAEQAQAQAPAAAAQAANGYGDGAQAYANAQPYVDGAQAYQDAQAESAAQAAQAAQTQEPAQKPPLPYVPEEEIDRSIDYGEYTFNSKDFQDMDEDEQEAARASAAAAQAAAQAQQAPVSPNAPDPESVAAANAAVAAAGYHNAAGSQPAVRPQTMAFGGEAAVASAQATTVMNRQQPVAYRGRLIDLSDNTSYALSSPRIRIGRDSKNDIALKDINVSRSHAEIHIDAQGVWILTDLNSTNGTYVNEREVSTCALSEGDRITFGTTNLVFTLN